MKTLGMIGGIAPESTVDYYRSIIREYRDRVPERRYPHLLINSIDLTNMISLVEAGALGELVSLFVGELESLARAGADIALFTSNTPHLVFDEIAKRSPLPLISIVRAACDAAKAAGVRRTGLIGTRFTMGGGFYQRMFFAEGIEVVVPEAPEQELIHDLYMRELVSAIFTTETRDRVLGVIEKMRDRDTIDSVILAGTELPLLLRGHEPDGLQFLDTTQIHVQAAIREMFA